ncbi:MAG: hypothetical protein ABS939_04545 [Psychrobacillus sp.]
MNSKEQYLLSNIHRLTRQLNIKENPDIRHMGRYKSLLFEIKASKQAVAIGPNLIEIVTVLFATFALLISTFSIRLNVKSDTIFRFTFSKDIDSPAQKITDAQYLIKESYSEGDIFWADILYLLGIVATVIGAFYLLRQIALIKMAKKYSILEQYLEEYIKEVEKNGREVN